MHGGPAGGELNGGRSSPSCPCQLTTKGRRSRRPRPVAGGAATAAAAAAGAALLLILVVATMLVGPCDATSVRGAPPRRFTFLKRLRPRLRPTFRRIKSQRYVWGAVCVSVCVYVDRLIQLISWINRSIRHVPD